MKHCHMQTSRGKDSWRSCYLYCWIKHLQTETWLFFFHYFMLDLFRGYSGTGNQELIYLRARWGSSLIKIIYDNKHNVLWEVYYLTAVQCCKSLSTFSMITSWCKNTLCCDFSYLFGDSNTKVTAWYSFPQAIY